MAFFFTLVKVIIPMSMVTTIGLWIALTVMDTNNIKWNNKDETTREILYSLDANQLGDTQKDRLISNAIGVEILHLLFHALPCIGVVIGIWCQHFYTVHTMASFSFISLLYDNFDVVNRWDFLWASDHKKNRNMIYLLSHFFHAFCVLSSLMFSFFIGRKQRLN